MIEEIVRLHEKDYDQIIDLLDSVFSEQNKKEMHFDKMLPNFFERDEWHANNHFGIFDGEKLVAVIGIYPLPFTLMGETFLFTTVGNIATHPDYMGKGYMSKLCQFAVEESDRMGAIGSVLGGKRHRYNRFGYEPCGTKYTFALRLHDRLRCFPHYQKDTVVFTPFDRNDTIAIERANALYQRGEFAVNRTQTGAIREFYDYLCAWNCTPYLAKKNGEIVGYLTVGSNIKEPSEIVAKDVATFMEMLCAWQDKIGDGVVFKVLPHQVELIQTCLNVCGYVDCCTGGSFRINDWITLIDRLMKLKARYAVFPIGKLNVKIDGYATIQLYANATGTGCILTNESPDVILDKLSALRYFFGFLPPSFTGETNALATACLPLPLAWATQDRG